MLNYGCVGGGEAGEKSAPWAYALLRGGLVARGRAARGRVQVSPYGCKRRRAPKRVSTLDSRQIRGRIVMRSRIWKVFRVEGRVFR